MNKKLLLGVARGDITPELGCNLFGYRPDLHSESVNDNLTAKGNIISAVNEDCAALKRRMVA